MQLHGLVGQALKKRAIVNTVVVPEYEDEDRL